MRKDLDLREIAEEKFWGAASKLGGIRKWIIKFIFPEFSSLADAIREYYWAEKCPSCGTTDIERAGLDSNRYCNRCHGAITSLK